MDKQQWSGFKLRVNIRTSIENAYNAWTTSGGLESWFLRNAVFHRADGKTIGKDVPIKPGDGYEWYWHGYPDSVLEKGRILSANGTDRLSFTFSMGCPVTITIYAEADETIVELVESDLPIDEETIFKYFVSDSKGWIFYLANLKSVLEGGLDLRNRKNEITNVITS